MKEKNEKTNKPFFTAKKITTMAIFTALAYIVSFLEFPVFPAAPFLKLDFGNVFIMLVGFAFGPIEGIVVCVLKEIIRIPYGSTGGVGELANILMTSAYILLPATLYRFKKGLKTVIPALIGAVLIMTVVSLFVNRFINFPLFMGDSARETFASLWQFIVFFNFIKGVAISVVTCFLYKPLSRILDKF